MTTTTAAVHKVPTPSDVRPINLKTILAETHKREVQEQVKDMLNYMITESDSGWNSPLIVVPKKRLEGQIVHFRKLNEITPSDNRIDFG